MLLPEKFVAQTELKDLYKKTVKDLQFKEAEQLYTNVDHKTEFNSIQTQAFSKIYHSDESVFLGAPSGSDLLTCIELAIFRELQSEHGGKILYIAPNEILCRNVYENWRYRLGSSSKSDDSLGLSICIFDHTGGNFVQQSQEIAKADIIMSTPAVWETISRRWRQRKVLHQITLCIFD